MFPCEVCGKSFTSTRALKVHQRVHAGDGPLTCDQSGMPFPSQPLFGTAPVRHAEYECELCKRTFRSSLGLTLHLRYHLGEKYSCDQCPKTFIHPTALKVHMQLHSGEKPFQCKQCGRDFANQAGIKSHEVVHMRKASHICDICGKAFSWETNLKHHMKSHKEIKTSFDCSLCKKSFRWKRNLTKHLKNHANPKDKTRVKNNEPTIVKKKLTRYQRNPTDGKVTILPKMNGPLLMIPSSSICLVQTPMLIHMPAPQAGFTPLQLEATQNGSTSTVISENQAQCDPEMQDGEEQEQKHQPDLEIEDFIAMDDIKTVTIQ